MGKYYVLVWGLREKVSTEVAQSATNQKKEL
jgi:hypothetical protein